MRLLLHFVILGSLFFLVACQSQSSFLTSTPVFVTATLPPTPLPPASPSPTATIVASHIVGVTTARVNVRPGPGSQSEPLGILDSAAEVEILGQDVGGGWYQIVYPNVPEGKGWVNATYIRLPEDVAVPTIGLHDKNLPQGIIKETLHVRSRPDSGSASLGILFPKEVVVLSGKSPDGAWLQIEYPAGTSDQGWIASAYVEVRDIEKLPVVDEDGAPLANPTMLPAAPSFTLLPAPEDGDSAQTPAAQVIFSPGGARQFRFTGQVSAPQGDVADWVAFTPYSALGLQATMHFRLECSGRGELEVQLLQGDLPVETFPALRCGGPEISLKLDAGQRYQLYFRAAGNPSDLHSVGYIIAIQNGP